MAYINVMIAAVYFVTYETTTLFIRDVELVNRWYSSKITAHANREDVKRVLVDLAL